MSDAAGSRYRCRKLSDDLLIRDDGCRIHLQYNGADNVDPNEWILWGEYKHCDLPRIGSLIADALMAESREPPEWRPLSMLTREVAAKWHTWAVTFPGSQCAVLHDLTVVALIKTESWPTLLAWHIRRDHLGCDGWMCRPVDREGVPVPWLEVEL